MPFMKQKSIHCMTIYELFCFQEMFWRQEFALAHYEADLRLWTTYLNIDQIIAAVGKQNT